MTKRLIRQNKMILGVCGGIGSYFSIDPTIIRILFVLAFFGLGAGLLLYIIMAIVMPDK
jgi:phage shock protein C